MLSEIDSDTRSHWGPVQTNTGGRTPAGHGSHGRTLTQVGMQCCLKVDQTYFGPMDTVPYQRTTFGFYLFFLSLLYSVLG